MSRDILIIRLRRTLSETTTLFVGMGVNIGVVFDQQNVPGFGHGLRGRGSDTILIITSRIWTQTVSSSTRPGRLRLHLRHVLVLEVHQGHVLHQVLAGHGPPTDLAHAALLVLVIEELEALVQERLEVDVLPLQGLDTGVVRVAVVESQVQASVPDVAAVREGTLVDAQPLLLLHVGHHVSDLRAVVTDGQVVDQAVPVLLPLVRALGSWQGADKLGRGQGGRGH